MKPILLLFIALLHSNFLFATALQADILTIENEEWGMLEKPLNRNSALLNALMNYLPKERTKSTDNPLGYTGYWILADEHLYLEKIEVEIYNQQENRYYIDVYNVDSLKNLFPLYYEEKGICARWFSGEIRAGRGKVIRSQLIGFERDVEEEYVFNVCQGKIGPLQRYHNYKKQEGVRLLYASSEIAKRFPFDEFPEIGKLQLILFISRFTVTPDGHFVDCDLAIRLGNNEEVIENPSDSLIKAVKKALHKIYPWEVFYLNGIYRGLEDSQILSMSNPKLIPPATDAKVPVCSLPKVEETIAPYSWLHGPESDTVRTIEFVLRKGNKPEYVAINYHGKEVFKPFIYDNRPDRASEGLFRIVNDEGRIGYADKWGNILIQPQYKFAFPFYKNKAVVTYSGKKIREGEDSFWETPEWEVINRQGIVLLKCKYINKRNIEKGIHISLFDLSGKRLQTIRYSYPSDLPLPRHFIPKFDWIYINSDGKKDLVIYLDQEEKKYDYFLWDDKQKKYISSFSQKGAN